MFHGIDFMLVHAIPRDQSCQGVQSGAMLMSITHISLHCGSWFTPNVHTGQQASLVVFMIYCPPQIKLAGVKAAMV